MKKIFLLLFLSSFTFAGSTRFDFRDAIQRNSIEIGVEGPLERTTAISHYLSGWAEVDLEDPLLGLKGEIEFDTRTLETGLEGKNLFIKDRVLEANRFPLFQASFKSIVGSVTGKPALPGGARVQAETELKLKGQVRSLVLPLQLHYYKQSDLTQQRLPGNLLTIKSDVEVPLEKLGIVMPEGFRAACGSTVRVILHMTGSDKLPVGAASLPSGFKPKDPSLVVIPKR